MERIVRRSHASRRGPFGSGSSVVEWSASSGADAGSSPARSPGGFMSQALLDAILRRADYRCAWCGCNLLLSGIVCRLDASENDSAMVASCAECAREYAQWWPAAQSYSVTSAKRFLGRCPRTGSGPFVDYLEGKTAGRGYLLPFNTALARVEAQRNAPLDLRRRVA